MIVTLTFNNIHLFKKPNTRYMHKTIEEDIILEEPGINPIPIIRDKPSITELWQNNVKILEEKYRKLVPLGEKTKSSIPEDNSNLLNRIS